MQIKAADNEPYRPPPLHIVRQDPLSSRLAHKDNVSPPLPGTDWGYELPNHERTSSSLNSGDRVSTTVRIHGWSIVLRQLLLCRPVSVYYAA